MLRVIIDNGVNSGCFPIPPIVQRLKVVPTGRVETDLDMMGEMTHGTECAAVIEQLSPGRPFVSLRILDKQGRGEIQDLLVALDWCETHGAKLIHMSMGSADYYDFAPIRELVQRLLQKQCMIVAAYHNMDIPSYPAFCPGVFGVRFDRSHTLADGCFAFEEEERIPREENRLIARFFGPLTCLDGKVSLLGDSNSFAAPVITAHFIRLLEKCPDMDFQTALHFLRQMGQQRKCSGTFLDFSDKNAEAKVPVIAVSQTACFKRLNELFLAEEYRVAALSEKGFEGTIPKGLYRYDPVVQPGLFFVLEHIYHPDVILYELGVAEEKPSAADLLVVGKCLEMDTGETSHRFQTIGDLFSALKQYFQS